MAVLWAMPAWGVPGDAGEDLDAQHHEERFNTINVLDHGAACDFLFQGDTPTDDAVAIQAAIDAAANSGSTGPLKQVYFPGKCYTTATIDWPANIKLIGGRHRTGGIYCADNIGNCIEVTSPDGTAQQTTMENFTVQGLGVCVPEGGVCHTTSGACTSCDRTTAVGTAGSGINFRTNTIVAGEGPTFNNVWVQDFPEFGIDFYGSHPMWAQGLNIWRNGWADPDQGDGAGTITSSTDTVMTDSEASWTDDEHIGKYLYILTGAAAGQIHGINDNDATTITVSEFSTFGGSTPTTADTYKIDYGGGIHVKASGSGVYAGCSFRNTSGDNNDPALIVVSGTGVGGGSQCTFFNTKSEPASTGRQLYAFDFRDVRGPMSIYGVTHSGGPGGPLAGSAAIHITGPFGADELHIEDVTIAEAQIENYIVFDINDDAKRWVVDFPLRGHFPNNLTTNPRASPPFTCTVEVKGNPYYDTDLEYECICNGSAWKPVSDPAGTTCS